MRRGSASAPGWALILAAVIALLATAELASLALDPGSTQATVAADEGDYFSDAQLDRARDYGSGQRLLFLGGLLAQVAALAALARGRPRWARRALERAGARPLLGGFAAAACVYVAFRLVRLPFSLVAHERAVDVGLSTQSLPDWGLDVARSVGIGALLFGLVGMVALWLMRRFRRRWWIPGAAGFVALAVLFTWVTPVLLAPVYNDFDEIPPGQVRSDVIELADRAGVDVGEIDRVDASRRTTGINAYVDGIGSTKRVVLYDNLIDDLDRGERRSVVAHELTHAANDDVPKGLVWVAAIALPALLLLSLLAARLAGRSTDELGLPIAVPALGLALVIVSFLVHVPANRQYRAVEAHADTGALELTDDPAAVIRLQREFAISNVSDPSPPGIFSFLFGTHPTTMQRIGSALAWEGGERP